MLPTAIIAFREFLEALLITGAFLGLSRQLNLKKELEILLAACIGILLSFAMAATAFVFGNSLRGVLTESNAELFEGYLMLISGVFIAYVVFALHRAMSSSNRAMLEKAKAVLTERSFDVALFVTICALILREGFEIALFTSSVSLFADFVTNMYGLLFGFLAASIVGALVYVGFTRIPLKYVFSVSEYAIIALGAYMVQGGVSEILEYQFGLEFEGVAGVLVRVLSAAAYAAAVWFFFLRMREGTSKL